MPQYRVRVLNVDTGEIDWISMWADDVRQANRKALKLAAKLLETPNVELAEV